MVISVGLNPALPCDTGARGRSGIRRASLPPAGSAGSTAALVVPAGCQRTGRPASSRPGSARGCQPQQHARPARNRRHPDARRPAAALPGHGQVVEQAFSRWCWTASGRYRSAAGRATPPPFRPRWTRWWTAKRSVSSQRAASRAGSRFARGPACHASSKLRPKCKLSSRPSAGAPIWCASRAGRDSRRAVQGEGLRETPGRGSRGPRGKTARRNPRARPARGRGPAPAPARPCTGQTPLTRHPEAGRRVNFALPGASLRSGIDAGGDGVLENEDGEPVASAARGLSRQISSR